jgi:5'-nucleotidase
MVTIDEQMDLNSGQTSLNRIRLKESTIMSERTERLNILLTNDDGIYAEGLWTLYKMLHPHHHVSVIAPDRERSAVGHGITLHRPLRATRVTVNDGFQGWAVSGTPADCVKLAVVELLEQRPDMVISGINPGANTGVNLNYSGTVAAAKEAALYGLKALAVSIQGFENPNFEAAARFVARMAPVVNINGLPKGTFLNINVPDVAFEKLAGVSICRQGSELYDEYFEKRTDPRNRAYYWQGSESQPVFTYSDVDGAALLGKYVSVTPVRCDMTDYDAIQQLKQWNFNGFGNVQVHNEDRH